MLGLYPQNHPQAVDELIAALAFDGDRVVSPSDGKEMSLREALIEALEREREHSRALAVVVDFNAVGLGNALTSASAAHQLGSFLRAHYPQRCGTIHVVNLPPPARWAVSATCALLDSRTAKKVPRADSEH